VAIEIERKFLVDDQKIDLNKVLPDPSAVTEIKQAFIVAQPDVNVRVRTYCQWPYRIPPRAELAVKIGTGPIRNEYEQPMDLAEAEELLKKYPSIHKIRYIFHIENSARYWEVDKFLDAHEGLWLAEIELGSLDEEIELPDWIGEEVTWNAEYYNCNLAK